MENKILFFDTKPYDKKSFEESNEPFHYEITYLKTHLNQETAKFASGYPVCALL